MTTPPPARSKLFWRLAQQAQACWPHLGALFLLGLLAPPLALLAPLPLKIAFDSVLDSHPLPRLIRVVTPAALADTNAGRMVLVIGLVLLVAVLTQLRESGSALLATYTGEKLLRRFRAQLFGHAQRLSLAYHDRQGTADTTYRIQYDAMSLQGILVDSLIPSFASALTFVSMLVVTARISWRLVLVGLAIAPLIFVLSRHYRRRLRSGSREARKVESSALSIVHEVLGAARVVKAFGQEDREEKRFVQQSSQGMLARMRLAWMEGTFGMLINLITAAGMAAVLFIGMSAIKANALTRGDLLLVMGYLAQLYTPLKTIGKKVAALQGQLAGAERAFALLDQAPDVRERPRARPLARAAGGVKFCGVSFSYQDERAILREVSFAIPPGTCLGIAGTTGAGKTTLVNLLARFYDPSTGAILLDGVDLRDYRLADLRRQFALVLQEPVLFSTNVAENIAYARPEASETEIVAAAQAANADEFIRRLPDGYASKVGERGLCLSGGERQRISIARAFLKDAPILILDEPTSSVDVRTEAAIVEAMRRLVRGRTTLIIAHRLSTLAHCDQVLRLEHGQVVEAGPPSAAASCRPLSAVELARSSQERT